MALDSPERGTILLALEDPSAGLAMYPNGRALTDHVVAARFAMISKNSVPNDGLGPHDDLLEAFPYLGTPHANPPPPPPPPE